jgi:hypothetical protein
MRPQTESLVSLKIAVQMDPIASINPVGDSTFALMLEAQSRGTPGYYTPKPRPATTRNRGVAPIKHGPSQGRTLHPRGRAADLGL